MNDEEALFKATVGDIRPLKNCQKKVPSVKLSQKNIASSPIYGKNRDRDDLVQEESISFQLSDYYIEEYKAETLVSYMVEGESLCPDLKRKIQQGNYPKEGMIDLHGETIESARDKFSNFLHAAYQKGKQGLFLVHGKGKSAILKNHVIHWLKQIPYLLYFCSAVPAEGGSGALYVLLKRKRKESPHLLSQVREKIDELDSKMSILLCERFHYAEKAAALKKDLKPDMVREREILNRMKKKALNAGISSERMEAIYKTLLEEMRKHQIEKQRNKITIL